MVTTLEVVHRSSASSASRHLARVTPESGWGLCAEEPAQALDLGLPERGAGTGTAYDPPPRHASEAGVARPRPCGRGPFALRDEQGPEAKPDAPMSTRVTAPTIHRRPPSDPRRERRWRLLPPADASTGASEAPRVSEPTPRSAGAQGSLPTGYRRVHRRALRALKSLRGWEADWSPRPDLRHPRHLELLLLLLLLLRRRSSRASKRVLRAHAKEPPADRYYDPKCLLFTSVINLSLLLAVQEPLKDLSWSGRTEHKSKRRSPAERRRVLHSPLPVPLDG